MTVRELCIELGSKSKAAIELGVNRTTVKKYHDDKAGNQHLIRTINGVPTLFARIGG